MTFMRKGRYIIILTVFIAVLALFLRHRQTEGLSHTDIFVEGRYLTL